MNRTRSRADGARALVIPALLCFSVFSSLPQANPVGAAFERGRQSTRDERGVRMLIAPLETLAQDNFILGILSTDATRGPAAQRDRRGDYGDLTGMWQCNDGGMYFMRQVGGDLWWYGRDGGGGRDWANVFRGQIRGSEVIGDWVDVPVGRFRNIGNLQLRIDWPSRLSLINQSGNFSGSEWRRYQ